MRLRGLFPDRLSTQLTLFVCALVGAAVVTLAVLVNLQVIEVAERQQREHYLGQAATLVEGTSTFMQAADFPSLENYLRTSADMHQVVSIYLLDTGGIVLMRAGNPDKGSPAAGNRMQIPATTEASIEAAGASPWFGELFGKNNARYVVWNAIENGGHIGWVRLEVSRQDIDALKADIWLVTASVLAGALVLIWYLSKPRALS